MVSSAVGFAENALIQCASGPLVGLNVLRTKIVVLNSEKAINDLLNERGNIYSDRPELVVAGELMRLDQVYISLPRCIK